MSIGTGLFLGLACLATVFLYSQTKDRWRWRRIVKWGAIIACTPLLLGAVWLGLTLLEQYQNARPRPVDRYAGVAIGESMEEVRYSLGTPAEVLQSEKESARWKIPGRDLLSTPIVPDGAHLKDYLTWTYRSFVDGWVEVEFFPESRKVIRVFCKAEGCPSLLGMRLDTNEDEVLSHLGAPSRVELSGPVKVLHYSKYHTAFFLLKRRVYALQLELENESKL
jgi:hypothetical protein